MADARRNAETARPIEASLESFRRTPANCCAVGGREAAGQGCAIESSVPCQTSRSTPPPPQQPRLHLLHPKTIHSAPVHFCKEGTLCRMCMANWKGSSYVSFRLGWPRRIVFLFFQGFILLHAFLLRFKRHRSQPRPAYAVAVEIQTGSPPTLERKE